MKLLLKIFYFLTVLFFLQVGAGYTDTVLFRNGDRLTGDIKNDHFAVRGAYSQIVVSKSFCKNIKIDPNHSVNSSLQTVNNDFFSGTILNREIQINLDNDSLETIAIDDLDSLLFDISGPSHPVMTTIFTMTNGDRFSGNILNPKVKIRAENMSLAYEAEEINRIDFSAAGTGQDKLLLVNGDIVQGKLLLEQIRVNPDSIAQFSADISKFRSIQFNSRKMLIGKYKGSPSSNPDLDQVIKDVQLEDEDGDGVANSLDKCPQTPTGAHVDGRGCWLTDEILFDFDSYLLKSKHHSVLENVLAVLTKNPELRIEIQGGTDNIGTAEYNQTLSEQRAQAVKTYLVKKGIDAARLNAVGYGSARKAATNETATGRALNRRIDFMVIN